MKRLIVTLMLGLLIACVGPEPMTRRAPAPEPTSNGKSDLMRKPPECRTCGAEMRRRIADCGAASNSCMSRCTGDAMQIATCQSMCTGQYGSCAAYASTPGDCPAYCAL